MSGWPSGPMAGIAATVVAGVFDPAGMSMPAFVENAPRQCKVQPIFRKNTDFVSLPSDLLAEFSICVELVVGSGYCSVFTACSHQGSKTLVKHLGRARFAEPTISNNATDTAVCDRWKDELLHHI
jgi:hypothetical protein